MLQVKCTWIIVLLMACSFFISCSSPQSAKLVPTYSQEFDPNGRVNAEQAFAIFSEACQPLMGKYSGDIESISIDHGFDREKNMSGDGCLDYRCREYGWDKQIYIKIKLKDKTDVIPTALRAWGHTLHFFLGGPKNPGITLNKIPELCGKINPNPGSDIFIPEPRLAFIK